MTSICQVILDLNYRGRIVTKNIPASRWKGSCRVDYTKRYYGNIMKRGLNGRNKRARIFVPTYYHKGVQTEIYC